MRSRLALIVACSLAVVTTGCGFGGDPAVSDADRRTGAETHAQLLQEFGGAYPGDEAGFVVAIGEKMARSAGLEGQCTFTLVNSDVVNAFAVPGCYIYVTRGLLGIVNSEGELASVLAHELGHIKGDHSERQQNRSILRSLGVAALGLITDSERVSRIASAAAQFFTLRYSRKHEFEADDLGLSYLRSAGYDPFAAADMLDALRRHSEFLTRSRGRDEARSLPEWASTHPLTENRIGRSRTMAAETGLRPDQLPEFEANYLRAVDGLLYGDDPAQGFVLGRRFAHPVMRITFEAPEGFSLTNSPQAILIEGPDGMRGEFAGGKLPPGGLRAYAEAVFGALLGQAEAAIGAGRSGLTNGLPTLVVPATVRTEQGDVTISLAAYQADADTAYHFLMVSPPSTNPAEALGALFASFRLLSPAEAASLRARRIEVVTVSPADTLQTLAGRMSADQPAAHFLMLNGRDGAERLRPGERVKLVVPAG